MSADVALVEVPYLELVHSLGSNFLFVGLGLLLGTAGLVDPDSSRGLVAFLQWVALPAILFRGMATMDKSSIQGLALAALVFSKALVVAGTGVLAVLFSRREDNKWKSAGICALFSALTNDVSFGLPIARVLFPAQAFYLFIPIQSLLFEPICLCLLEVGAASDGDKGKPLTKGHLARTVLRGIATNQILIVIFLGLLYNTLIGPWLPNFATSCLKTAGEAFPAVALFHVGLKMVVASAFASYYMAQWLLPQDKEFQNFAFMYGALPVASVSFVFASKYDAFPTVIGGAFILSMMLSPCVMFLQFAFAHVSAAVALKRLMDCAMYLSYASVFAGLGLVLMPFWVRLFNQWPLRLISHMALAILLHGVAAGACITVGYQCFDQDTIQNEADIEAAPILCHEGLKVLWDAMTYLRFYFSLQVQIWPVILLSNKQLWWRYGAEQARRCAPGFALVGWLFPALVTLACTPFAKQRITHLGLMFAPGGPERGILMVAYVLLMAVGLWALMGTRHSILPYIFSDHDKTESDAVLDHKMDIDHNKTFVVIDYNDKNVSPLQTEDDFFAEYAAGPLGPGCTAFPEDTDPLHRIDDKFRFTLILIWDLIGLLCGTLILAILMTEKSEGTFQIPKSTSTLLVVLSLIFNEGLGVVTGLIFLTHPAVFCLFRTTCRGLKKSYSSALMLDSGSEEDEDLQRMLSGSSWRIG